MYFTNLIEDLPCRTHVNCFFRVFNESRGYNDLKNKISQHLPQKYQDNNVFDNNPFEAEMHCLDRA